MGFNVTSWGQKGRSWGRGSSPPRGSIEWIAVGDMWDPNPPGAPRPNEAKPYTDRDAATRWIMTIDRNVKQARKIHGDKILSKADETAWGKVLERWKSFEKSTEAPGAFEKEMGRSRKSFDDIMDDAKAISDRFTSKGLVAVPPPYLGELLELLRGTPKKLDVTSMAAKLVAGARCGEKLLDEQTPWSRWSTESPKALKEAIGQARKAASIYGESKQGSKVWSAREPAYDEFLRRLTAIWVAGATMHGLAEPPSAPASSPPATPTTTSGASPIATADRRSSHRILWLLGAAGAGYLGIFWLTTRKAKTEAVAVPDALPPEYTVEDEDEA